MITYKKGKKKKYYINDCKKEHVICWTYNSSPITTAISYQLSCAHTLQTIITYKL